MQPEFNRKRFRFSVALKKSIQAYIIYRNNVIFTAIAVKLGNYKNNKNLLEF